MKPFLSVSFVIAIVFNLSCLFVIYFLVSSSAERYHEIGDLQQFQWSVLKTECRQGLSSESLYLTLYVDNLMYSPGKYVSIQKTFPIPNSNSNLKGLPENLSCRQLSDVYYKFLQMNYWNPELQTIKLPGYFSSKCMSTYEGIPHSFELNDLMKSCFLYQELEQHSEFDFWLIIYVSVLLSGWIYSLLDIIQLIKSSFKKEKIDLDLDLELTHAFNEEDHTIVRKRVFSEV